MKKSTPLEDCIVQSMEQYFADLNGETPNNLHSFFIGEVERPFLQLIMEKVNGNQTRASDLLGINRNTLRKKLKAYDLS